MNESLSYTHILNIDVSIDRCPPNAVMILDIGHWTLDPPSIYEKLVMWQNIPSKNAHLHPCQR